MSDRGPHSKKDDELLEKAIPIPPQDDEELEPIAFDDDDDDEPDSDASSSPAIRAFGAGRQASKTKWKHQPVNSGRGARHVRTFVAKLRLDAIEHLDEQINEWLDNHPEVDVKFVTTSIGQLVGKNTEDALFVNVWV